MTTTHDTQPEAEPMFRLMTMTVTVRAPVSTSDVMSELLVTALEPQILDLIEGPVRDRVLTAAAAIAPGTTITLEVTS